MSEEVTAIDNNGENLSVDDSKENVDEVAVASAVDAEGASLDQPDQSSIQQIEELPNPVEKSEPEEKVSEDISVTKETEEKCDIKHSATEDKVSEDTTVSEETEEKHGIKRRASAAFSVEASSEEFKGFDQINADDSVVEFNRVLVRIESEVKTAIENITPVKSVTISSSVPVKASKRLRQDTDGSRPSSALSSRSDGDGITSSTDLPTTQKIPVGSATSSPAQRGRRTIEISSPLLRVPLDRGWRRELVYRANLDAHARRNSDIYYYTPHGKKLRSMREISENLSGTGLTLENFSFFKEPLGVDDPEREIIRDARMMRRVESPVAHPPPVVVEGKRTPKPKAPKGASPDPPIKSPPAKIKVKSFGSRLNNNSSPTPTSTKQKNAITPGTDNNNSAAWKKPRQPPPTPPATPEVTPAAAVTTVAPAVIPVTPVTPVPRPSTPPPLPPPPPPPLQCRPPVVLQTSPEIQASHQVVQPCSMACGDGAVPSLACYACLCLYHPACAGYKHAMSQDSFLCKNCRKPGSPPLEPPPLTHKSGMTTAGTSGSVRRMSMPARGDKRVLLRMKVSGGGPRGERVWAVTKPAPATQPRSILIRPSLPQSMAVINGRRFIVVPRSMPHDTKNEDRRRNRLANGASSPPGASIRRRGRTKDETDYFSSFFARAKERNYNVGVQIFQYLGMRDLAHCARVCKLWQELAGTPVLWRHVRMKNSQVSDWGGLCAALKRNGTKRLDLRKMLQPQIDTAFWEQFAQNIGTVNTLETIEMCRCPASAVEAVCRGLPGLRAFSALAIKDDLLDPSPLGTLTMLHELRLKSIAGLSLTRDLRPLATLTNLHHLSLTSIKELGWCACDVIGELPQLESLELGECTFRAEFALVLRKLTRLRRLRLERGTAQCAAPELLRALAHLPHLTKLELVNVDVKVGFDDALAECKNIQRLLIIPTYVSQSATTNKQVLSGVLRLKDTLTHLMWGVTIELLRVTELFIDQCEQSGETKKKDIGECIPVLKPVPGGRLSEEHHQIAGPPQVEILPLPRLQRLLSTQLPNTKLKLLRIPFHATWRQSLADFQ